VSVSDDVEEFVVTVGVAHTQNIVVVAAEMLENHDLSALILGVLNHAFDRNVGATLDAKDESE
jgi:hypothetical protein